ncbi:hypothetical protein KPH14_012294, partial [Odynerus spinipes]
QLSSSKSTFPSVRGAGCGRGEQEDVPRRTLGKMTYVLSEPYFPKLHVNR